ncbi:CHAT domain-containing protein [Lachnospiraceae bacterium NSJ-143]|nr:CHAT domain-containing protein [Lachnospiraceae bacterium NSJ-143]
MKKLILAALTISVALGAVGNVFGQARYSNTGYVYGCIGEGDGDNEIDTFEECGIACDYIKQWGYFGELNMNPVLSDFQDSRLNSPILYFAGHGTNASVNTGGHTGISYGTTPGYKDISKVDLSEAKMIVLSACNTASYPNDNITKGLNSMGVDFTLGWKVNIEDDHARRFVKAFFKYLTQQYRYVDALSYGLNDLTTGADGENPMWTTAGIYNYQAYGNINSTIYEFIPGPMSVNEPDRYAPFYNDNLTQYEVNEDVYYYYKTKDFDMLEDYFKRNIDENFNISDYDCSEFDSLEEGDFNILPLRYKVGNIVSDFGYNVAIDKGKVFLITELGNNITKDNIVLPVSDISDDELCSMVLDSFDSSYPVDSQIVEKMFDTEKGVVKYHVLTVLGDDETGYFAKGFDYYN